MGAREDESGESRRRRRPGDRGGGIRGAVPGGEPREVLGSGLCGLFAGDGAHRLLLLVFEPEFGGHGRCVFSFFSLLANCFSSFFGRASSSSSFFPSFSSVLHYFLFSRDDGTKRKAPTLRKKASPKKKNEPGLLKEDWSAPSSASDGASTSSSPSSCLENFKLNLLAAINPAPTRFDAEGNVVDPGGGAGYDSAATPMPEEVARAMAEFSRAGGGGGGGGGADATANGTNDNGNNSAPSGSSASPLPAPVATSHPPSGITVTTVPTKSWASGNTTAFQCDVRIKNESGSSTCPPTMTLSCGASIVEQSWNCNRLADKEGKAVLGLPEWCVSNGGIAPGAEVTAGGVFLGAVPAFEVGFS